MTAGVTVRGWILMHVYTLTGIKLKLVRLWMDTIIKDNKYYIIKDSNSNM